MSDCCSVKGTLVAPGVAACPENGARSKQVDVLTVKSLVRRLPLGMPDTQYYFCEAQDCDAVYFALEPQALIFRRGDLLVRVGAKETADPIPVCYCFGFTRKNIQGELVERGRSTIVEEITREVRAGNCACEVKNPSGKCCLGSVRLLIRDSMRNLEGPAARVAGQPLGGNDSMTTSPKLNLDELAASVVRCFPALNLLEQRLSLELYRLLAEGQPVPRMVLAERLGVSFEAVNRILDGWPGVFSDTEQRIVGYWGLSIPTAYGSPHTLKMNGQMLSAWCAWDTLFLPQLVGHTAEIESVGPAGNGIVRLTVTPERLDRVEPVGVQMSILLPDAQEMQKDVVTSFCHFVHFFPTRQTAESWIAKHAGTFMLSIHEAHVLARLKNEAQYHEALK
jgi:alkylmercury lyase